MHYPLEFGRDARAAAHAVIELVRVPDPGSTAQSQGGSRSPLSEHRFLFGDPESGVSKTLPRCPMLRCMVARNRPRARPDRVERFYAEVKRDAALRRADGFRRARDREGARQAAREAARWDRQAQELLSREKMAEAEQRRDYFARLGIELAAAGDMRGARKAAQEAERWDREAKGLGGS